MSTVLLRKKNRVYKVSSTLILSGNVNDSLFIQDFINNFLLPCEKEEVMTSEANSKDKLLFSKILSKNLMIHQVNAKGLVPLVFRYIFFGALAELAGKGSGEVGGLGKADFVGYFCDAVFAGH